MVHIRKTFWRVLIAGALAALPNLARMPATATFAAPAQPQATPIVGGTSFATAVAVTPGVEYTGSISGTTKNIDAFYVDVQPSQLIVINASSGTVWNGGADLRLYDQDHVSYISQPAGAGSSINNPEVTSKLHYMGNTTTPTRYYFRAENLYGGLKEYAFNITLSSQNDAAQAGDAGDTASTARAITPTLGSIATYTGTLGQADKEDWLRIPAPSGAVISAQVTIENFGTVVGCAFGTLYDQSTNQLDSLNGLCKNSTTQDTFIWRGSNSTPSAFLIKLDQGNTQGGTPAQYKVDVFLTQADDAGQVGDAGDALNTARVITPSLNTISAYSGTLGGSDKNDWLRITATSGQILSLTITLDDFASMGGITAYLHDQAGTQLLQQFLSPTGGNKATMRWMTNATSPSAFLFRLGEANTQGQPVLYHLDVELAQQKDVTTTGDAPDTFDTARPISATPDYLGNQIGFSDKDDFFKMQVPQDVQNTPYKFFLKDVSWPANSTGKLTIRRYSDNRQQLGQDIVINAPATESGQFDICNGCFVRVSYDDKFVVGYNVRLLVIKTVYLPFLQK